MPAPPTPSDTAPKPCFVLPVRVYYEDTDAGGVVYYANYLKFCERARTDWLRSIGFEQAQMAHEQDVLFVVRRVQAEYLQPALLDDLLDVHAILSKLGRASLVFSQQVLRKGQPIFQAEVTIACVSRSGKRAIAIPTPMRHHLATLV
ncbi:tol-pal system-associated acyl-CoA thioesterase [Zoogloea sp.]|uniref:tol-pal system-associated acyl-CoA thioesterase n=1 Tax=Zoogloea sp. TaxID=49181 RepID=UPI002636C275|nr:tol-pal system-associated acyl-CoA thioesterase [Zoogloea sp.]MDD3353150.1 tol-pal system-associated acyl-CoA thioesterase [Zoogloea sp.]